jgi:arylsulfatase A-like enzyme
MSKRIISILSAAAGLVFTAALEFNCAAAEPQGQPNILVIMSDEHNASVLGCYGNKYVYHTAPDEQHPAQRELYDLQADPGEFRNLAAHPEQKALMEKLHAALIKELGEDPEQAERRCRADYAKGYSEAPKGKRRRSGGE